MSNHIRITKEDIRSHICYIEEFTDYRIVKKHDEKKQKYHVLKNNKIVSVIISNTNNDVYDMLEPYWMRAFIKDCEKTNTDCPTIKKKFEL